MCRWSECKRGWRSSVPEHFLNHASWHLLNHPSSLRKLQKDRICRSLPLLVVPPRCRPDLHPMPQSAIWRWLYLFNSISALNVRLLESLLSLSRAALAGVDTRAGSSERNGIVTLSSFGRVSPPKVGKEQSQLPNRKRLGLSLALQPEGCIRDVRPTDKGPVGASPTAIDVSRRTRP
jgi:hypothetical protein